MAGVGQHGGFALGKGVKSGPGSRPAARPAHGGQSNAALRRSAAAVLARRHSSAGHSQPSRPGWPTSTGIPAAWAACCMVRAAAYSVPQIWTRSGAIFLSRAEKFSTLPVGTSAKLTPFLLQTVKVSARASTLATVNGRGVRCGGHAAQRAGKPTPADLFCLQTAGIRGSRDGDADKPEYLHISHLTNSAATACGTSSGKRSHTSPKGSCLPHTSPSQRCRISAASAWPWCSTSASG